MMDPLDRSVGEAMVSKMELDGMLSSASGQDKIWLAEEAGTDPDFSASIEAHQDLSRLALGLQGIYEEKTAPEITPENADMELDEQAELEGIEKEYDIDAIHAISSVLDKQIQSHRAANHGRDLTKKQLREVKQTMKQLFRDNWTVDEISDSPRRLSTIMNSLICNEDVAEDTRSHITGFITGKVEEYVKETAETATPDIIAKRLRASLETSPADIILQNTLIKPYFKAVEGKSAEEVLDNRETFIRGILRTYEYPSVCRKAMAIAKYETRLVEKKGYYSAMEQLVPAIRLDQPQMLGRSKSIQRALVMIDSSLSDSLTIDTPKGSDSPGMYSGIDEMKAQIMAEGITKEQRDAIEKGFGRMSLIHGRLAVDALGQGEYQKRVDTMAYFNEIIHHIAQNPIEFMSELAEGYEESSLVPDTLDIVIGIICEEYPEQRQFLTDMVKTDSVVSGELAKYIPDPRNRALHGEGLYTEEFAQLMSETVLKIDDSADPAEVADLFESSLSEASVSTRTDDGFVIEVGVNEESEDPGPEFWSDFFEVHTEQIERAKGRISQAKGLSRQFEIVFESPVGATFVVRPETDQDRKQFHPIDEIIGIEEIDDANEQELLALIEESKQNIEARRRRFLNDRGIMYTETEDGQTLSLVVQKHPKNPQAFVCTVEMSAGSDRQSAKIVMDSSLRFQLGNKRVRSTRNMLFVNTIAATVLEYFTCEEAVETSEGLISDENNSVTSRIAHLRLLPEGHRFSYEAWSKCLESEGLDLEVLSRRQQIIKNTLRTSTYVQAVEKDGLEKEPLLIYI